MAEQDFHGLLEVPLEVQAGVPDEHVGVVAVPGQSLDVGAFVGLHS